MKTWIVIVGLLVAGPVARAQVTGCSVLGQKPETAFPVCGSSVFHQSSVPICTNAPLGVPGCSTKDHYADKNPFWYRFTCFEGGSLDFLIEPRDPGDDYDWQLYDITGHAPGDVYNDPSLIVAGNWAGTFGNTGARPDGVTFTQCASDPVDKKPSFARSPRLVKGHHYLLMVSHFTDSQSGYSLSFKGGTAVITDTTSPHLSAAIAGCDGSTVSVRLNKQMQCGSLAADGSEFSVAPSAAGVAGAASVSCTTGFDMDSLTVTLDRPLPPGHYRLVIGAGTDGNTLLDNCDTPIPEGESVPFIVQPPPPTPMDSVSEPGCAPVQLQVNFAGPMRCSSIAADGSDFALSGPESLPIIHAEGIDCTGGLSSRVMLTLGAPIVRGGVYTLALVSGADGNTVLSECNVETPPASVRFTASDTVYAAIRRDIGYSCNQAAIRLANPGGNGINSWSWSTVGGAADGPAYSYVDSSFDLQTVTLRVSNGVCSDSAVSRFQPDTSYWVRAAFGEPSFVCPNDLVTFVNGSRGDIGSWTWSFGNGNTSFLESPPQQQYPIVVRSRDFLVRLRVENTRGCVDTAVRQLHVINNCMILVPTAFTPNGDGMNDYLYPLNAYKAKDLRFRIFNRYGQLMFETTDWTRKWDGRFHGVPQPMGSYVWMLRYVDSDTGEKVFKKGATLLIR